MLIKRLEVKGFKSLRDVVWEPGPLTVVIGPNGSGKSNLLQCLSILRSIANGELENYIQTLGGMHRLIWDGISEHISISAYSESPQYIGPAIYFYTLLLSYRRFDNMYSVKNELFQCVSTLTNSTEPITLLFREGIKQLLARGDGLQDVDRKTRNPLESLLSLATDINNYDDSLCIFRDEIADNKVFQAIDVSIQSNIRRPVVPRYTKSFGIDGQNLVNVLHTLYSENRDFENDINTAMRAAFGDDFDRLVFPPAADQLVQLRIRWKTLKREQSMADLSDGTIRFLFLMAVLCNPEPLSLIAIDEPETGLHPSMFPIIAEYAAEASKRTQVIFSTHSPQFLDAFSDFDVTTTVTTWRDGETRVKNLDGEALKDWLKEYSLGSLFLSGDLEALA
jgi:predicted ATPase